MLIGARSAFSVAWAALSCCSSSGGLSGCFGRAGDRFSGYSVALHLIKLCVGAESIDDLAQWQEQRRQERRKRGEPNESFHVTRQTPRRASELLDGGSLYWVIKGQIAVRQRLLELRQVVKDGGPGCALILDHKLVPVARRRHRPFQGWRYLTEADAPRDLRGGEMVKLPDELRAELASLGLI